MTPVLGRRLRAGCALPGLVLALILPAACGVREPRRPDVILVTLDTTRADHLGAYGYARDITPSIDRLAADAVLYRRAWSSASWTLPAHASIFTGKQATSHGAHFDVRNPNADLGDVLKGEIFQQMKITRLGEEQVTLAELLKASGYATAAFIGGPFLDPVFGALQGYDVQDADIPDIGGRRADELTDRAIAWLRAQPRERPIHLFVNYFDPHRPYDPPPGYDDLPLAKAPIEIPADPGKGGPASASIGALIDRYDGEIRFMDGQLGRLLQALREAGRYEGALIIVVADHGESFGEHGMMEHGRWLYEDVIRVPLIVRFPGGRMAGRREEASVSVVDLLPLVAGEVGLSLPAGVEGVPVGSRRLVLAESRRDKLFIDLYGARFDRDLVAAVRWPWKVILSDRGQVELYRLDADAGEIRNVADGRRERPLLDALRAAQARLSPPGRLVPPRKVGEKTMEQLRSLGYVE